MSSPEKESSANEKIVDKSLPLLGYLLLAALSLSWGCNWPVMKIALAEIPPWTFRMLCLVSGGVGLITLVKTSGMSIVIPKGEMGPLILASTLNITAYNLFSAHGLVYMEAGRASIIAYTMPVWAAILGRFMLKERLTMGRLFGLGLGIGGLAILIGSDIRAIGSAPAGTAFMLGAAISWAAGTVSIKYFVWSIPTAVLTGWQLILGSIPVVIGALILEQTTIIFHLSWQVMLAMGYIIFVPIIFGQWAWFKIVSLFSTTAASIGALIIPIVGVFSSALVLGEQVGLQELTALALVVMALAIVMIRPGEVR